MNKNKMALTEKEIQELCMGAVDLSTLSHRQPTPEESKAIYDRMTRLQNIGVKLIDEGRGHIRDMTKINTKYFETYGDYLVAQDKVRRQIEFKEEPVDIDLEQRLIAETRWIKQQRIEAARKRAMDK